MTEAGGLCEFGKALLISIYYYFASKFPSLLWYIAEIFLTAYQAMALNGRLQDGETVLIHAVSVIIIIGKWFHGS